MKKWNLDGQGPARYKWDSLAMSNSAVKTRNMAASKQDAKQPTQVALNSMVHYFKKAVAAEERTTRKAVSTPSKKTPKRKGRTKKGKTTKSNAMPAPEQTEIEVEMEENNSESEVCSESDNGENNFTLDAQYSTLADLEIDVSDDIDPRTVSLSAESQPLLILALLKKLETLESKQEEMQEENENLKKALEFNSNKILDLESDVTQYKKEADETKEQLNNVNVSNNKLREESSKLRDKTVKAEAYSRRNNLRFEGIVKEPNETQTDCRNTIYAILVKELGIADAESRIVIERCHRDQRYPNHNPPSILVRFLSYLDRDEIWQKRDQLNRNQDNKLYMNQDFPPEVERKRAFLRPYVKAAYAKGRKAVLVGDMLMVDGKKYSVNDLESLPEDISPDKIAIQEKNGAVLFYRADAYLSNFYKAPVQINNTRYVCVEQYFTAEKARMFKDQSTVNRIMDSQNPTEMKFLGRNTKNFNQKTWDEKASTVMLHALRAKFNQNPKLQEKLISTQDKILAEASKNDKVWGIGLALNDQNAFLKDKWQGRNQLGNLLMTVRDEIIRTSNRQ